MIDSYDFWVFGVVGSGFFLVASFLWIFMFFSIFFFLSYRRENMSGLYFSSNQTKLVQKKSKGKLSIEMNLKKKLTDGKIKSVVKTCRKVKWNKIEVNFVGVMYIIWKLYDWNSLKIACNFKFEANARLITVKHNLMSWRWQLAKLHGNYSKRKVLKIFPYPA